MQTLNDFLAKNLTGHRDRLGRLKKLSVGVARLLLASKDQAKNFWPYSCKIERDSIIPQYPRPAASGRAKSRSKSRLHPPFSVSTQAMVCASINEILKHNLVHQFLNKNEADELRNTQVQVEIEVLTHL